MTQQRQYQEVQPFIVGQRSCHLNGIVNLTAWYVNCYPTWFSISYNRSVSAKAYMSCHFLFMVSFIQKSNYFKKVGKKKSKSNFFLLNDFLSFRLHSVCPELQ